MALLDDLFKVDPVTGVVLGIGAIFLGPILLPAAGKIVRPAVKAVIKSGLIVYDEMAEIREATGKLFAETNAELTSEPAPAAVVGPHQPRRRRPAASSSKRQQKRSA